ncbi:MAG TPA: cyclopropane fatty acyl phospholipid synthase [Candidatus Nitrosotenuis sp.]|nr:cyclopropane fatty acyl phospholipid synthase [Candidatus Nitrosotenuis sp.]
MKNFIQELFSFADIKINGTRPWDIIIHNENFYLRLTKDAELSLGEMYMDGWWDCPKLDEFFYRILQANLKEKVFSHPKFWRALITQKVYQGLRSCFNFQTKRRAVIVGEKHYDVGNDLYKAMLDKRLVYTCAYWDSGANNLDEAQEAKLELTCQKLQLEKGMKVLDIGCGWGSFAKYASEKYDVSVVGVTISKEQLKLAQEICKGLPIDLRLQDYRDLAFQGESFDRIVSLGMFEHVGYKNYPKYMNVAANCLKDNGIFLLHTIGSDISTTTCSSQWIVKYIFPNGQIPSIQQIGSALEGLFVMEDWHNFGPNYDKTLMAWHKNFNDNWFAIKDKYDERFRRMWSYYLLSCAASFRARKNHLWQIVLSKGGIIGGYERPVLPAINEVKPIKQWVS